MSAIATGHPAGLPPAVCWSPDQLCVFSVVVRGIGQGSSSSKQTNWIKKRTGDGTNVITDVSAGTVYTQYNTYDIFHNFLGGWHGQNEQQRDKRRVSTRWWHIRNLLPYDDDDAKKSAETNTHTKQRKKKNHNQIKGDRMKEMKEVWKKKKKCREREL